MLLSKEFLISVANQRGSQRGGDMESVVLLNPLCEGITIH